MGTQTLLNGEEVARLGNYRYEKEIRAEVETPQNIGKMVIIDIKTGDYEVDELGLEASRHLYLKRPNAPLYGTRIGYDVAESLGGTMEKTGV